MQETPKVFRSSAWLSSLVFVISVAGCIGNIGEDSLTEAPKGIDPGPGRDEKSLTYSCAPEHAAVRGVGFAQMRRLSSREIANTVEALLGEVAFDSDIRARVSGLPVDETVMAGDFTADTPNGLAIALARISKRAAQLALKDEQWMKAYLPPCASAESVDASCAAEIARTFGTRVWRRDLADAEVEAYVSYFESADGGSEGLAYLMRRLLQSPSLVFHIEEGAASDGGRIRLTDFEVASRISYMTADTMPDDELMAAARAGELQDLGAVRAQVSRLLSTPRAAEKARDLFRYYSHLSTLSDPLPAAGEAFGLETTAGLGVDMRQEAYAFFEHVFWDEGGTFTKLMTSTDAFPRSEALARILETKAVLPGEAATGEKHPGLLHRPALLARAAPRTSPNARGARVRKLFLCDEMSMPDPGLVQEREEEVGDVDDMSNRDRVTTLTDAPACLGCHARVNAVGFTFEGFDQLGARREVETVFDAQGEPADYWPIDTRVTAPQIEPGGPEELADSVALATAMAESFRARACFSRRVFEYYRLSTADAERDGCTLSEGEVAAHESTLFDVVVAAIANEDIFWRKAP